MGLILTIVRHGNTFAPGEAPRRIGAGTDIPLVTSGREQARALAASFAAEGASFDAAFAAPLLRTRQTADLILAGLTRQPAIAAAPWLTEIDHGPDEGQLESDVAARVGHEAIAAWDAEAIAPDGWVVDADARLAAWRDLWATAQGHLLIVTSNGAGRFALLSDPALQAQAILLPSLKLRTGAYGRILREDGKLRLATWDQRPDLPIADPSVKAAQ